MKFQFLRVKVAKECSLLERNAVHFGIKVTTFRRNLLDKNSVHLRYNTVSKLNRTNTAKLRKPNRQYKTKYYRRDKTVRNCL